MDYTRAPDQGCLIIAPPRDGGCRVPCVWIFHSKVRPGRVDSAGLPTLAAAWVPYGRGWRGTTIDWEACRALTSRRGEASASTLGSEAGERRLDDGPPDRHGHMMTHGHHFPLDEPGRFLILKMISGPTKIPYQFWFQKDKEENWCHMEISPESLRRFSFHGDLIVRDLPLAVKVC